MYICIHTCIYNVHVYIQYNYKNIVYVCMYCMYCVYVFLSVQEDRTFLRDLFSQLQDEATPEDKYRELVSPLPAIHVHVQ